MVRKNSKTEAHLVPPFIKRVQESVKIVDVDTLIDCSAGLAKRIRKASGDERARLCGIKEEIDFLINNL